MVHCRHRVVGYRLRGSRNTRSVHAGVQLSGLGTAEDQRLVHFMIVDCKQHRGTYIMRASTACNKEAKEAEEEEEDDERQAGLGIVRLFYVLVI